MSLLDPYALKARYLPAAIALSPVVLASFVVVANIDLRMITGLVGGGSLFGYVLAQIARVLGKRCEDKYWKKWGGEPVVLVLQGQSKRVDRRTLERYRAKLAQITGEPDHGNTATYETWSKWLRANTRAKSFSLLLEENTTYGFWRNSLGLKYCGCIFAALSVVFLLLWFSCLSCDLDFRQLLAYGRGVPPRVWASIAGDCAVLLYWCVGVTENRMRRSAITYAEQLLETVDTVGINESLASR